MFATDQDSTAGSMLAGDYQRQALRCLAATQAVLESGRPQVAALLAVQAVRAAANALLTARAGLAALEESADPIVLLYTRFPLYRGARSLALGAEVLAYDDDLRHYGYEPEYQEAGELLAMANRFCAWATTRALPQSPAALVNI